MSELIPGPPNEEMRPDDLPEALAKGRLPVGPHPSAEELYRARREPESELSQRLMWHVVGCAQCSEELYHQEAFDRLEVGAEDVAGAWERFTARAAQEAGEAGVVPAQAPAVADGSGDGKVLSFPAAAPVTNAAPRRRASRGLTTVLAWAAGLILSAGLAFWWAGQRAATDIDDPLRSGGSNPTSNLAWQPQGNLNAPPWEFTFPRQGTEPLRVTVFNADRSFEWTSPPTTEGPVPFPEAEQAKLQAGVNYFWVVLGGEETAAKRFRIGE